MTPHSLKRKTGKIFLFAALVIIVYGTLLPFPWEKHQLERCMTLLEHQYYYQLSAPNCDTLYFSGLKKEGFAGLTCHPAQARQTVYGTAFWYSSFPLLHLCSGTLLTSTSITSPETKTELPTKELKSWLKKQYSIHEQRLQSIEKEENILSYYMATHNVIDEGYNQMGEYQKYYQQLYKDEQRIYTALGNILHSGKGEIRCVSTFLVHSYTQDSVPTTDSCRIISSGNGITKLQTLTLSMPEGSKCMGKHFLKTTWFAGENANRKAFLTAYHYGYIDSSSISKARASSIQGRICKSKQGFTSSFPLLKGAEGGALTDSNGTLIGIVSHNSILPY